MAGVLARPGPRAGDRRLAPRVGATPAWAIAAVLAALYLLLDPPSADLAAQEYRSWLYEHAGFVVWDNGWYAGHHVPAYSILFPPLAGVLGPRVVGAAAAVAAAWCFERLVVGTRGPAARPAAWWFAGATAISLVTGRLTFALGVALACAVGLALSRRRALLAGLLAVLTTLASPVAGAFLALCVVAWALSRDRLSALGQGAALPADGRGRHDAVIAAAIVGAALVPGVLLSVAFPEGGDFPFAADAWIPMLAATLALLVVLPREERMLRTGAALYAVLLLVSATLDTPMGGNAARLGALLAGPIAALALVPKRRTLLLAVAPLFLYWQLATPIDDWVRASGDRSVQAAYYDGLLRFLDTRAGPVRIEIPFTDNHWESAHVGEHVALARGWERQLDRKVNPLFYEDGPLDADRYRRWLAETGVSYVALADAPLDPSAAREADLVRARPPYLRELWRDSHWRVFAVRGARGLADGGRVTALRPDAVDFTGSGRVLLRVRWTPYWRLAGTSGCVAKAGAWTAVELRRPGRGQLVTDVTLSRVGATSPRCSG